MLLSKLSMHALEFFFFEICSFLARLHAHVGVLCAKFDIKGRCQEGNAWESLGGGMLLRTVPRLCKVTIVSVRHSAVGTGGRRQGAGCGWKPSMLEAWLLLLLHNK